MSVFIFNHCRAVRLLLLFKKFIQPVKITAVGNAGAGTVGRVVADIQIIIGIAVEESEHYAAIFGDLPLGGDIGEKLDGGVLSLLGGEAEIQGASHGEGQPLIEEAFDHREIQVRAVVRTVNTFLYGNAIVKRSIEVYPDAFILENPLKNTGELVAQGAGYKSGNATEEDSSNGLIGR